MIKSFQKKFILIFMIITTATLLGVFAFMCISTLKTQEKMCRETLANAISTSKTPPFPGHPRHFSDKIALTLSFRGDELMHSESKEGTFSDDEIVKISQYVLHNKERYGKIPDFPLTYMAMEGFGGKDYAFYDNTDDNEYFKSLCLGFGISGILAMIIFYILAYFLSKWIIRPIEESIIRQRNFVADASHELKTPLTVILANASILRDNRQDTIDEHSKNLTYIREEAEHMSKLVADLLFLSRSDAHKTALNLSTVDLSEICADSSLTFEAIAYENDVTIQTDIPEDIKIQGDSTKLEQLMGIFLDNACKYTPPEGNIEVILKKKGTSTILTVCNTSPPIPHDSISHLFDRFYRVDEARTRANGYGLGLCIAKEIVDLHGGKIEAKYEDGKVVMQVEFN
ncbi:MAG: HAMP domain-containing histidine kinase [Eubacterium sp.]|nr:HAMP domain-containing histidine kinase [Eubacterium sp.]